MAVTEVDTFVRKFYQLWNACLTAHLDLDTHARNVWVGLRLQLGHDVPGPLHHQTHPTNQVFGRVSPSRESRRARRLAAREKEFSANMNEKVVTAASEEENANSVENTEEFAPNCEATNVQIESDTEEVDHGNVGQKLSVKDSDNLNALFVTLIVPGKTVCQSIWAGSMSICHS